MRWNNLTLQWVLTGNEKYLQCLAGIYSWSIQHNSFCFFPLPQMFLVDGLVCSLPKALSTSLTAFFLLSVATEALVIHLVSFFFSLGGWEAFSDLWGMLYHTINLLISKVVTYLLHQIIWKRYITDLLYGFSCYTL